jgi:ribonucleotide reductase alpha subunit
LTLNDVAEVYRLAYHMKCKGVTVLRSGSMSETALQLALGETPEEGEYFK